MLIKSKYIIQSFAVLSNFPSIPRCLKPHNSEQSFGSWPEWFLFQIPHYLRRNPSNLLGYKPFDAMQQHCPNISYESRRQIETFRLIA